MEFLIERQAAHESATDRDRVSSQERFAQLEAHQAKIDRQLDRVVDVIERVVQITTETAKGLGDLQKAQSTFQAEMGAMKDDMSTLIKIVDEIVRHRPSNGNAPS